MRVAALCDVTHVSLLPWMDAGHDVIAVDIVQSWCNGIEGIRADVRYLESLDADLYIAFPPCTHLASSGAKHWVVKGQAALDDALSIVDACVKLAGDRPLILENPIGRLAKHLGKPSAIVDPWEYAGHSDDSEAYEKATCLWTFNGARLPIKNPSATRVKDWAHRLVRDSNKRSATPRGLAMGIYLANKP